VSIALELRGVTRDVVAGVGTCVAHAHVLRDVDLTISTGEVVAVVGNSAAVSTLVLCAAGLLRPDAGSIRWFGDSSREIACQRVLYHRPAVDLVHGDRDGGRLHVLDASSIADQPRIARWASERAGEGDAILVATIDEPCVHRFASRVLRLSAGRLVAASSTHARVAEAVPV